ncbi:MAG TPA: hypothetical protein VHU90_11155 [Galbitalea sp.]|nr:hypothetical protein [Galbitalea sp.]
MSIYREYYGTRFTLRILVVFWETMSVAGLAVEYLFRPIRIPQPARAINSAHGGIVWDYTTFLNIAALIVSGLLYWLYRSRDVDGRKSAKDLV